MEGDFLPRLLREAILLLLVTAPVLAAPLQVHLVVADAEGGTVPAMLHASPVIGNLEDDAPEPVAMEVEVPGSVTLDLEEKLTWRLRVDAEGLWGPQPLVLGGGEVAETSIDLVPTATLSARIEPAPGRELPEDLGVRIRSPEEIPSAPGAFDEVIRCPIEEGLWQCEVPSGTFDLRLRAEGFLSQFFWELELPARERIELEVVKLVPGSAISGWLVTDDESPLLPGTKVIAMPQATGQAAPRAEAKHRSLATEAVVTDRGFFHLQGLRSGAFLLQAEQEGFVPIRSVPVVVIEDAEIELLEPLVLTRPAELRVRVDPALDDEDENWTVSLFAPSSRETEVSARSDSNGDWIARGLKPGEYFLMVADSKGSRVATEEVSVESPVTDHWVELRFIEVEGQVTLGEEPLVATLAFGGRSGMTSVKMEADEEGRFSGLLPRPGAWGVDVLSKSPHVFRRLQAVEVEPGAGSSRAFVEIELPATRLEGDVVDSVGNGVEGATVLAIPLPQAPEDPRERPAYTRTGQGGLFSFEGVEPAIYRLQAILAGPSGQQRQTEPVEVSLREEDPFLVVRLTFEPSSSVAGRVLSRVGGVPGASVRARAHGGGILVPSAQTGPDGRFKLSPPAGVDQLELTVMAPGFLLAKTVAGLDDAEELSIFVEQEGGGTLVIQSQGSMDIARGRGLPWVVRSDGTVLDVGTLKTWSSLNRGLIGDRVLEVPMMPPGTYSVCWPGAEAKPDGVREPDCISGYLPAYSRLEIAQDRAGGAESGSE